MKTKSYLIKLKQILVKVVREQYDNGYGGRAAIRRYSSFCYRIKDAKTVGELFLLMKEMRLDLDSVLELAFYPLLKDTSKNEFADFPSRW